MKTNGKILIFIGLIFACLFLSGCSSIKKVESLPQGTPAAIIKPVKIVAQATATPAPTVVVRETIKSRSPMRIKQDVPNAVEIPGFYTLIDITDVPHAVYAYHSATGSTEFRVYAEVDELEDGIVMNTLKGFFKASITAENGTIHIETNKEEWPVDPDTETPAEYKTCVVPTKQNINAYIRKANEAQKKYEKSVANAKKKGTEIPDPPAWDGLPVLTKETTAVTIPRKLQTVRKIANLYYYESCYREKEYRRYATPDGYISGFYVSTSNGTINNGALMVSINDDMKDTRLRQRKAVEKPANGLYRIPVYITLNDGQQMVVNSIIERK